MEKWIDMLIMLSSDVWQAARNQVMVRAFQALLSSAIMVAFAYILFTDVRPRFSESSDDPAWKIDDNEAVSAFLFVMGLGLIISALVLFIMALGWLINPDWQTILLIRDMING